MKFEKEFKEAIVALTESEKDKLLLRLLKKDKVLANQLHFQLIDTKTVEEYRIEISAKAEQILTQSNQQSRFRSDYLLFDLKEFSGIVNDHVSKTKDKYSEPYLNLKMLICALSTWKNELLGESYKNSYPTNIYVVARAFKISTQIKAMHEDLQYDFKEELNELGFLIVSFPNLMKVCIYNGLDVNWLINFTIPDDIARIQKELRANGFLK